MTDWQKITDSAIAAFIRDHENDDIRALALKKPPSPGWPYPLILDQIKSRQKAAIKMPAWHAAPGLIFPPATLMEQASSEATARYKASLVSGAAFADLTAGSGIDFHTLLQCFTHGIAVERDETAAQLLAHNLAALGVKNCEVKTGNAQDILSTLPPCDLIYLDPARRAQDKRGLFLLTDSSPDILQLLPVLREKSELILLKTSPVLDITAAITDLKCVMQVHVVEWRGDCREVLYLLDPHHETANIPITAVALDDSGTPVKKFTFTRAEEESSTPRFAPPGKYLYEPGPAFQKAGGFRVMAAYYGLAKLHLHTHLYTSAELRPYFPGRIFEIHGVYGAQGRDLPVGKANLTLRNFPSTAEELRKKLKLKDGGDDYLFACTLADGRKALIHARKALSDGKEQLARSAEPA